MAVARFNLILKKGKENSELIEKAKKIYPDGKLPAGAYLNNFKDTKYDLEQYINTIKADQVNEKFPIAMYKR